MVLNLSFMNAFCLVFFFSFTVKFIFGFNELDNSEIRIDVRNLLR